MKQSLRRRAERLQGDLLKLAAQMETVKMLLYDLEQEKEFIHQEAHRLEHAFSKETLRRIDNILNNPRMMPTGKNIPH